jgi:hypothetical protein
MAEKTSYRRSQRTQRLKIKNLGSVSEVHPGLEVELRDLCGLR